MNAKQYNNIIAHMLKNECAESKSSLDTARAVLKNMGVAVPSGTMKEVYDTIGTNDYMGWRSCSMEEAQEAANSGTAAIGISENDMVVLSAEDGEDAVTSTETVMNVSDDSDALVAADLQYYAYNSMTTGASSKIVRIYREDNKVVFANSGKTWYCIHHDLIYGDPTAFDDYYQTRSCYNTYVRYNPDDVASSDWRAKQYTLEELKLLYIIDPYGVAHYLKKRAEMYDELSAQIGFKDSAFRELYRRNPKYYARDVYGNWYETESRDFSKVVSESETLFGMHQIYDFVVKRDIANFFIFAITAILQIPSIKDCAFAKAVNFVVGHTSNVISLGEAIAKGKLPSFISDEVVDKIFEPKWVLKLISLYNNIRDLAADSPNVSDFCREKLNYCATKTDYTVYLQLKNNQFYRAEDFCNAIRN